MCPECGQPMVILEFNGIEVDHCTACGGTWLDASDLEEIDYHAGVQAGSFSALLSDDQSTAVQTAGEQKDKRHCPRCDSVMIIEKVGTNPVEVDRCPIGHGYWFDRGELKALVSCQNKGEEGAVANFLAEVFRHDLL